MKSLVRKTVLILRAHPLLWAPYFAAAALTCSLSLLRRLANNGIAQWALNWRAQVESVLGGNPGFREFDPSSIHTVRQLRSALQWGTDYVNMSIYAVALVLTATMVGVILRGEGPVLTVAGASLRTYPKRILLYSAKAWLLSLVLYAALWWPIYVPGITLPLGKWAYSALSGGLGLLDASCFAWVIAPVALNLLRPADSAALSAGDKRSSRYIYLLVVIAQWVIGLLLRFLAPLPGPYASNARYAAYYFIPLVDGSPFVFAYVAYALIANPELQDRVTPVRATLPGWLRSLMPLHDMPPREL